MWRTLGSSCPRLTSVQSLEHLVPPGSSTLELHVYFQALTLISIFLNIPSRLKIQIIIHPPKKTHSKIAADFWHVSIDRVRG